MARRGVSRSGPARGRGGSETTAGFPSRWGLGHGPALVTSHNALFPSYKTARAGCRPNLHDLVRDAEGPRRVASMVASPEKRRRLAGRRSTVRLTFPAIATSERPHAAPPRSVMKARRFMSDMGACSPPYANAGHQKAMALCGGFATQPGYHGGEARSLGRPELF